MKKVLVSNCLLGVPCRYDGCGKPSKEVLDFLKDKEVVGICPEHMGGLSTPRNPAERIGDRIISSTGVDVSAEYSKGANMAVEIAREVGVDICLLKANSPSCGCGKIYDGTFSGKLIDGDGCTTTALKSAGFVVIGEGDLPCE